MIDARNEIVHPQRGEEQRQHDGQVERGPFRHLGTPPPSVAATRCRASCLVRIPATREKSGYAALYRCLWSLVGGASKARRDGAQHGDDAKRESVGVVGLIGRAERQRMV